MFTTDSCACFVFLGSNSRGTKAEEGSSATGDWVLQGTKV